MIRFDWVKSAAMTSLEIGECLLGAAQAASVSALAVGSGTILATAWFDRTAIGAVIADPVPLQRCLTIAAAAAMVRIMVYLARGESIVTEILSAEYVRSADPTTIIAGASPPPQSM